MAYLSVLDSVFLLYNVGIENDLCINKDEMEKNHPILDYLRTIEYTSESLRF